MSGSGLNPMGAPHGNPFNPFGGSGTPQPPHGPGAGMGQPPMQGQSSLQDAMTRSINPYQNGHMAPPMFSPSQAPGNPQPPAMGGIGSGFQGGMGAPQGGVGSGFNPQMGGNPQAQFGPAAMGLFGGTGAGQQQGTMPYLGMQPNGPGIGAPNQATNNMTAQDTYMQHPHQGFNNN